ncbi:MAG TPA: formate dehydrogenase subunit gamma [Caulobacteraceae bacterium]|nr:formate dehydrogenase subunit gamma [Caulobacteraceae bacterium]
METFEPWSPARTEAIIAPLVTREGALLPILHALQDTFGCVPREAVPLVAAALNLSRAEVHGVVTFYHDFREAPHGRRVVKLCRAESCQAMGAEAAGRFLLAALGLPSGEPWGGTTADGAVTVEAVYCLGLCAVSPAALIDGEPRGRVDGVTLAEAVGA